MNTTLRNTLQIAICLLSLITVVAFVLLTHPVVLILADEIVPVR